MKISISKILTTAMLGAVVHATVTTAEEDLPDAAYEMKKIADDFNLPSFSLAVMVDNDIVFADAVGWADINAQIPATADTQYSVGSIAKPMTGIAVAKLMTQQRLNLEAPVSEYVQRPEYTDQFSVSELGAHLAGVPHDTKGREIAEFEKPRDHLDPFDAFYAFDTEALSAPPGTEYSYSSNGYILLSAVVQAAAGQDYVDYLNDSLWQPTHMTATALDTASAGKGFEATYYANRLESGDYEQSTTKRDRSFLFGGGGFISTPSDLTRMATTIWQEDYLSEDAREALMTPVPLRSGEINEENYSLGFRVGSMGLTESEDVVVLHHGGVTDQAATAYLLVVPACRAAVAFATNHIPDQFWRMRGRVTGLLVSMIDPDTCSKA